MKRVVAISALVWMFLAPPCRAQEEQPLVDVATAVANELSMSFYNDPTSPRLLIVPGCKVLRFPIERPLELPVTVEWGERFAASLRTALSRAVPKMHIVSEQDFKAFLERQGLHPSDLCYETTAKWAAKELSAHLVAFSAFGESGDNDTFRCWVLWAEDGKRVAVRATAFAKNEGVRRPTNDYPWLGQVRGCSDENLPRAGRNGVSIPTCIHCPNPQFTDAAVAARVEARILLCVTVESDGRADDIATLKGAPFGLAAAAIRSVSGWRLEPAKDANGKPVAVRTTIEIIFRQY